MHYVLYPQCSGTFGKRTLYGGELLVSRPDIYRLHYEFTTFPEDELQVVSCQYIATTELVEALRQLQPPVNGVQIDNVTATASVEMRRSNPGKELPPFQWLKVSGKPGQDDFGMSSDHQLVVSERVLLLMEAKIPNCRTSPFTSTGA